MMNQNPVNELRNPQKSHDEDDEENCHEYLTLVVPAIPILSF
jgi:hypothetical protein